MVFLTNEYTILFLLITLGIIIGKIKISGISLDTPAIFFVALVFGYFGLKVPSIVYHLGLIFFMYSIGVQAGPGFFESFRKQGKKLLLIALILTITGGFTTVLLAKIFGIDLLLSVGLFTGSLTSASSLAVTIENTQSALPSIGFGIAFPFGVVGVVIITRLSPKIFKVDLVKEEGSYLQNISNDYPKIYTKNFIVENPEVIDKTIEELKLRSVTHTNISGIYQKYALVTPKAHTVLKRNDILRVSGTSKGLALFSEIVGQETNVVLPVNKKFAVKHYIVTNNEVINKALGHLTILQLLNITITTIRRSGIEMTPNANSKLRFGDRIIVAGPDDQMNATKNLFGNERSRLDDLDFLPVALGVLIGIIIGKINIPFIGGTHVSMGLTGGVLVASLALSNIGKTGKIIWNISGISNQILRKLGLIFFLSGVGADAGSKIVEILNTEGIKMFFMAVLITVIPMFTTLVAGKFLFRLNFLQLLGALTGSMTSTPALTAIQPLTKTNAPQVAYATVYPIALILIIIISQIMVLFL